MVERIDISAQPRLYFRDECIASRYGIVAAANSDQHRRTDFFIDVATLITDSPPFSRFCRIPRTHDPLFMPRRSAGRYAVLQERQHVVFAVYHHCHLMVSVAVE